MTGRFFVATRKGLFTVARRGSSWSVDRADFVGDNVTLCHVGRGGRDIYAAFDHGHFGCKLQASRDGGETWKEIGVPTYPEKPEDVEDVNPANRKDVPWTLKLIWAFADGGDDGELWCGTIPGGLFHSTDAGVTWSIVESLWNDSHRREWFGGGAEFPGIHSVCVDPRNADHVTVGISCGGVWRTEDLGKTWDLRATGMRAEYMPPEQAFEPNIQDPHCIVRSPIDPGVFWCQHHNGIFRSTDDAVTWTEITDVKPSVFGFPVVVHPTDPNTAWFVPALKDEKRIPVDGEFVVTRTRDGGETFDILRGGLPQAHAYDIVLRHALDIDETGDRLAMGTTTGSVFVTENGGEKWECVSAHLPPVYAVRWG